MKGKERMNRQSGLILFSLLSTAILFAAPAFSSTAGEASIEARLFKSQSGSTMPYRILKPANYDPKKTYPLVLCLHGAGGRGADNKSKGTEAFVALSAAKTQSEYPAFLLTPQCPSRKQWVNTPWRKGSYSISKIPISKEFELVVQILDAVEKEFSIDSLRIYVTGQSMGGYGTWDIVLRHPNRFAAAVPVCGAGDHTQAKSIAHIPIWAFHGDKDTTVPTRGSREMVEALKKAGSKAKYTEYEGVGHNSWSRAWKEEDLIPWIFKQHNKAMDSDNK
jgi:predicted peptidase